MVGKPVRDRTNQSVFVSNLCVHRHQLAHVDARYVRVNRTEYTPVVFRRVRLHVVRFHVRWSTGKPNENDGRVQSCLSRVFRVRAQPEQIRHTQQAKCQRTDLQKTTS